MLGCMVRLFTVTKIGHAKEVGSTNVAKAFEAFDPNAIISAGERTWELSG